MSEQQEVRSHEMQIGDYFVRQSPSIFQQRNNRRDGVKFDICIWWAHGKSWGLRREDGRMYRTVAVIACEDGHVVRGRIEAVPDDILKNLEQWGFNYSYGRQDHE